MKKIRNIMTLTAVALFALLPVSLLAAPKKASPIVVSINDVPNAAPVIQVQGAPNGFDINTVLPNIPTIEDGALITLFGVDTATYPGDPGALPDWEGRFVVPTAPNPNRKAVDIVWVEHDFDNFGLGDLRVGFNSAFAGTYYGSLNKNILGLVTDEWVTVYANDTLVIRYKPHTYRLRAQVERPFKATGIPTLNQQDWTFLFVGTATHLGNFVFSGTWGVIGLNPEGGFVYEIHGVYTAANGDTIEIECPDWGIDDGANPEVSKGIVHIIGGTGRFANASGSYVGALSPVPTPTLFTADGTISY